MNDDIKNIKQLDLFDGLIAVPMLLAVDNAYFYLCETVDECWSKVGSMSLHLSTAEKKLFASIIISAAHRKFPTALEFAHGLLKQLSLPVSYAHEITIVRCEPNQILVSSESGSVVY